MNDAALHQALREAQAVHHRGDLVGAEQRYAAILARHPNDADALALLGALHLQKGDHDRALQVLLQALRQRPGVADVHYNISQIYLARGDLIKAESHLAIALKHKPDMALAHRLLAAVYHRQGRPPDAIAALQGALAIEPSNIDDVLSLIDLYRGADDTAGALRAAEQHLARNPQAAALHVARAELLFAHGRLREGWEAWAWRLRGRGVAAKAFPFPTWNGEPLGDKSILVWGEGSLGGEIMGTSLIGEVAGMAARCVVACVPRLVPLFRRSFPDVEFVAVNAAPAAGERFDYHVAIGDLGRWLRPEFAAFPARARYLVADARRTATLRAHYAAGLAQPFLIGVAWKDVGEYAAQKSIGLGIWGPIFGIPSVRFVSLQEGDSAAELSSARQGFRADIVADARVDPRDADAAAAQIAALDLVITANDAVAHLAGALGVATLCLLPKTTGRAMWFAEQPSCPWHPSVRCIVQAETGNWGPVIADVALAAAEAGAAGGAVTKHLAYVLGLAQSYMAANLPGLADKAFARADALAPDTVQILYEWSRAKKRLQRHDDALAKIDAALRIAPQDVELHNARGMALAELDRQTDAVEAYRTALALNPRAGKVHNNLGTALRTLGRPGEALGHYERALEGEPEHASILFNLAGTYSELGDVDRAVAIYDRVLAANPAHVDAHYNKGQALLRVGRFADGWRPFGWRLRRADANVRHDTFAAPVWSGQPLDGRKVLIWTEQGLGDEIMVASFVPDVLARARRVTFLATARLVPLFRRSFPGAIVALRDAPLPEAALAPDLDVQMSLSELGSALRCSYADFPAQRSFLVADPGLRATLRARYEAIAPGNLIVGISWRSTRVDVGTLKSAPLTAWLPILKLPGITFVNLQYGDTAAEREALEREHGIRVVHDPAVDPMGDMDAFAAQVAAMDLVVSTSNTTVHFAGGLGVPTFLMLSGYRGRLWYWFLDRKDSPWYPALRLYEAAEALAWEEVIAQIAGDVRRFRPAPGTIGS